MFSIIGTNLSFFNQICLGWWPQIRNAFSSALTKWAAEGPKIVPGCYDRFGRLGGTSLANELLSRYLKSEPVHAERTHVSADISNNNNGKSCVKNFKFEFFEKDLMGKGVWHGIGAGGPVASSGRHLQAHLQLPHHSATRLGSSWVWHFIQSRDHWQFHRTTNGL